MKKVFVLLAVLSMISASSFSQDKGYFAVNIGPSIATGDFASTDNKEGAGFAKGGAIFDLTFAYEVAPNFGLMAMLRGQANTVDAQALADEFAKQNPLLSGTVEATSWGLGGLMIGAYGSLPLSNKVFFQPRAMIGFMSATSPEVKYTVSGGWIKQSSQTAGSMGYLVGAGFKFDVAKRLCLLTGIEYSGTKVNFKDVETTTSFGEMQNDSFDQTIGAVNISLGIGVRL